MLDVLKTMTRYNAWANKELYQAVRDLPEGEATKERPSLFKNIVNTLNHPLVTDRIWWAHLHGEKHGHKALNDIVHADFEELAEARAEMDQRIINYSDSLTENQAGEEVNFTLLSGAEGTMTKGYIIMHMVNHNTYHRGFVVETFCQIPAPLPLIDLPVYMRGAEGLSTLPPHLQEKAG